MNEGQLVIDFGPHGVRVTGPMDNQVLCYGLLEIARDVVRAHAAKKAAEQRIVPATIVPPNGHIQR